MDHWQLIILTLFFAFCMGGFFWTKTEGFGRYGVSVLVLTLVLYIGAVAFMMGKVDWQGLSPLLLAIVGFAGGIASKNPPN